MNASAHDLAAILPPGFTMGVATAAFQIEGALDEDGRGPSGWDVFAAQPGMIVNDHSPAIATDHYHRMPEDVALMKELGVDSYRFSLSWPRIQPGGSGPVNPKGLDFYDRLIDLLLANGITPMATLYHWDTPLELDEAGGWMNRDTAYRLGEFAAIAAAAYGDRVARWVTINEPATVSANGYMLGLHSPGEAHMLRALPSVHHQLLGHGLAMQALRAAKVPGEIGLTNVYSPMVPASINPLDKVSAGLMDMAQNRLYADPVLLGKYPDAIRAATFFSSFSPSSEDLELISQPLDFYGLNYYMPTRVGAGPGDGTMPEGMAEAMGNDLNGGAGTPFHIQSFPDTEITAYGWPIKPDYMAVALAEMAERYPELPPVYITEGGASFEDLEIHDADGRLIVPDERRVRYLAEHLQAAIEATSPGGAAESIDLRGYYVWSLLDNFEWSAGYKQQFGLLHVDRDTMVRTPKASFHWLRELLAARNRTESGAETGTTAGVAETETAAETGTTPGSAAETGSTAGSGSPAAGAPAAG
ncbi:GH1 family beta-glucosidase [Arthrobacter sp. 2YAF22_2]|uniref:GH1 family beta-glucosidase n=1 Tax=Arthrobacter sp. 2YAF22_2 TaxID=3233029 RepID=UPI003F932DD6